MFEAEIQKEEKFMQSLIEDGSLEQVNLKCRIDDKMSDILSMTKIGEILVISNPPIITLTTETDKQAQKIVPTLSKTINDISLNLLQSFEISKRETEIAITGCTIMPSGEMVFVDQLNDRLVIHNKHGLLDCEIPVSHCPVDVTCIDENTVAVTHNDEPYHIEIINIANKKIVKKIKTSDRCYGITNKTGRLIYYQLHNGIQATDVTAESTATTVVKYIWRALLELCYNIKR
ncbi:unnamed protein product [Mytilus coruscus]|uniref:Uncharacterized protein n=1 Tax=Mytilus coruscus TaxID=42192 RepID=A0A6J8ATI8_MYTCO|nr:unnamed protein product [Mytilus coruscus]